MKKLFLSIINWFKNLLSLKEKNMTTPEVITREFEPYHRPVVPYKRKYNNRRRTRGRNFQVISYRVNSHFRFDKTWNPGKIKTKVIHHN